MTEAGRRILFDEFNRVELRVLAPGALVVIPVGSTEQHGPHLPVGTDAWHAEAVARGAARLLPADVPVLVSPTLPFGQAEGHLASFGATISMTSKVYYDVVVGICESLITDGFRRLFILNGHGGNHELLTVVARDVALRHPVVLAAGSWWNMAFDALVADGALEVAPFPGHAGAFETAAVRAMRPDVPIGPLPAAREGGEEADPRRLYGPLRLERHGFWRSIDGFTDDPSIGTEAWGRRWLDVATAEVARQFERVARMPLPEPM